MSFRHQGKGRLTSRFLLLAPHPGAARGPPPDPRGAGSWKPVAGPPTGVPVSLGSEPHYTRTPSPSLHAHSLEELRATTHIGSRWAVASKGSQPAQVSEGAPGASQRPRLPDVPPSPSHSVSLPVCLSVSPSLSVSVSPSLPRSPLFPSFSVKLYQTSPLPRCPSVTANAAVG